MPVTVPLLSRLSDGERLRRPECHVGVAFVVEAFPGDRTGAAPWAASVVDQGQAATKRQLPPVVGMQVFLDFVGTVLEDADLVDPLGFVDGSWRFPRREPHFLEQAKVFPRFAEPPAVEGGEELQVLDVW